MRLEEGKDYLQCDFCSRMHFPEPDSEGVRVFDEPAGPPCPLCGQPLLHASLSGARLLYCRECRGMLIAMDLFVALAAELRAQRPPGLESAPRALRPEDLARRIRCPLCARTMDTHPYAGPGNFVIDNCPACGVNWLDYRELRRTALL